MPIFDDSNVWLIASNAVLAGAFTVSLLRYRSLKRRSGEEQLNQRELVENLSEGIYRTSVDGRQLSANKALVKLNGYDTETEMLAAVTDIATEWYVEPTRRDEFRAILKRDGVVQDFVSEIYRHKTRERIWISESARMVRDRKTGEPQFYEGSVREITETVKKLQAEKLLQNLSNQIPGGVFQFSRSKEGEFSISYVSQGFRKLTFYDGPEGKFSPTEFSNLVHEEDRETFLSRFRDSGLMVQPWDLEFRTARDGEERWLRVTATPETTSNGLVWHGYISDLSARKRSEMEIKKLAFYDPLTGLPNRRMFIDRMNEAVTLSRDQGRYSAVIFIDLDNFKTLNDTRGHDVGDEYLVQVAKRLSNCVSTEDTVARIGGDEFVVILNGVGHTHAEASRASIMAANRVLMAMRSDFEIERFMHRSSASLGVVVFGNGDAEPDEILKHADIAMYQVKAAGRNGVALYDHLSMSGESDRYRLLNDLKAAIASNALELHFQPQVDDRGRVVGAEALCRWSHPELGMLLPERFVPLTEQFGLIREFGYEILQKGIKELARWRQTEALANMRLAVNVNVQSFAADDFVSNLAGLLARHRVDPRSLTLELTEHVVTRDSNLIAQRMEELKKLGVRLSLDDFGSGYSSIAHLKRLPFDELKIDGCFVADIEKGESDRALIKSILGTARTLKLTAVAEHVENVRQEAFLRAFGCDFFQGYLYSPAMPASEFTAFVERRLMGDALLDIIEERWTA
jgi:diguanylate cyclase (GGDEF)-like protein/PAS domain S-box-containing protein